MRENLPNPYLNTMSANTSTRDTYQPVYGATPVIQIAWQSQVSSFSQDFEIPKFVAVITTNTKYHFRGRRTYYPGLNKLCPTSPPYVHQRQEEEGDKAAPPPEVAPLPVLS